MNRRLSSYPLGDMTLCYFTDDMGHVAMALVPANCEAAVPESRRLENLVQLHLMGDPMPGDFGSGETWAGTVSTERMTFREQYRDGDAVVTVLADALGRTVLHRVTWHAGLTAVRIVTAFRNDSDRTVTLDLLSSANLSALSPLRDHDAPERNPVDEPGRMHFHRARSRWSAEGRITDETLESLHLERSWSGGGFRLEKFGQKGSMPVRGFFPFAALEDRKLGITWAMQLACPATWQMELRRIRNDFALMASLGDWDFGHWRKEIRPGETFTAPACFLTVGAGEPDAVYQRLQTIHADDLPAPIAPLPLVFNEYCTTWGNPSMENLKRIAEVISRHGFDYMVIDCGWYQTEGRSWYDSAGDWIPNRTRLFPEGLKAAADMIRSHGLKPGIWFEAETCGLHSDIASQPEMLLHRDGAVLETGNRRFLDLRKPAVRDYLSQRVIGQLADCGFDYVKIDYNDSIGMGCDGAESIGEGLRQVAAAAQDFFRELKRRIPRLTIENCSSGGHRLEPSMLAVSDMSSFSDAHECVEIPIIAANLHRLMLPAQSQIWAVMRSRDSLRRINYSLVSGMLGVLCLSGDIFELSEEQWQHIDRAIAFYRRVESVIRSGVSRIEQHISEAWRQPDGWQLVDRLGNNGGRLLILHRFGGEAPDAVTIPIRGFSLADMLTCDGRQAVVAKDAVTIPMPHEFDAAAVYLTPCETL